MRLFALFFALFCIPSTAEQSVSKVAFTESSNAIRAFSPLGEITLPVVRVQLAIHYPAGKNEFGNLVVVYDPESAHYFWRYESVPQTGDLKSFLQVLQSGIEAVYAGPTGLVDFYMPGQIWVQQHSNRADNLDAALTAAIQEIRHGLPGFENSGYHTDAQEVPIARAIGMDFACAPIRDPEFSAACGFGAKKFVSISRDGDNWLLVVRNRWDQEVILDSKFNLVSTQRAIGLTKE